MPGENRLSSNKEKGWTVSIQGKGDAQRSPKRARKVQKKRLYTGRAVIRRWRELA